jgi:V/A-type H+-transporting ATPase subunit C
MSTLESRGLKYGYSNARVKAMKGLLLKSGFYEELIKVGSIEAMVELLQRTGYKGDLSAASVDYSGSELIEMAASRNFAHEVQKLLRITPKEDRLAVRGLLVKWDLMNLKTMMHARTLGRSYDEVKPYLFPVGGLSEDDFRRIMKAEEKEIFREVRRTELGQQMLSSSTAHFSKRMWDKFRSALRSVNMFLQMETIIDAYTYLLMEQGLAKTGGKEIEHIRRILKKEIDAKNIMIIERLKKHGTDPNRIRESLIRGGTLRESTISRLIEAKDLPALLSIIKAKFLHLDIKDTGSLSLTGLEIALEKSLAIQKSAAFYRAVLSVGVIVGFVLLKEAEINNLRKIAKGKEFNTQEEDVRSMLVVV